MDLPVLGSLGIGQIDVQRVLTSRLRGVALTDFAPIRQVGPRAFAGVTVAVLSVDAVLRHPSLEGLQVLR
jgi:hypothetical protein